MRSILGNSWAWVRRVATSGGKHLVNKWQQIYHTCSRRGSFLTTGVSVGILIGLSASPILGVIVTGIFGLVTILLQNRKDGPTGDPATDTQIFFMPWLPLGFVIGALVGIWMRVNDTLNFHEDMRHKYRAMGFSKYQSERLIDAAAIDALGSHRNIPEQLRVMGFDKNQVAVVMNRLTGTIDVMDLLKTKDATPAKAPIAAAHSGNSAASGGAPTTGAVATSPHAAPAAATTESVTKLYGGMSSGWFAELEAKIEKWDFLTEKQRDLEVRTTRALIREVRLLSTENTPESIELLSSYDQFLTALLLDKNGQTIAERWEWLSAGREELSRKIGKFFEPVETPK
ncbi:MAG: hypothetical protein JWP89_5179 [Schlesneria sp.]|nr:hypothetical protein [Schlesneria sp.]